MLALGAARVFAPGSVLLRQGERGSHVLVLVRGLVKVTATSPEGHLSLLAIRTAGDLVGELASLDNETRIATVTVAGPVRARIIGLLPLLLGQQDESATSVLNLLATLGSAALSAEHVGVLAAVADPAALCARLAELGLAVPAEHGYRCAPGVGPALRQRNVVPFPVELMCQYFTLWAGDRATPSAMVADHAAVLERIAALATEAGRPELAVELGRAVSPKLARSLRFEAWGQILGRGWTAARRAGDRRAEAFFTHEEGIRVSGDRVGTSWRRPCWDPRSCCGTRPVNSRVRPRRSMHSSTCRNIPRPATPPRSCRTTWRDSSPTRSRIPCHTWRPSR